MRSPDGAFHQPQPGGRDRTGGVRERSKAAVATPVDPLDIHDEVQPGSHGPIPTRTYRHPDSPRGRVLV